MLNSSQIQNFFAFIVVIVKKNGELPVEKHDEVFFAVP